MFLFEAGYKPVRFVIAQFNTGGRVRQDHREGNRSECFQMGPIDGALNVFVGKNSSEAVAVKVKVAEATAPRKVQDEFLEIANGLGDTVKIEVSWGIAAAAT
jgi:hypothetical protein